MEITVKHQISMSPEFALFLEKLLVPGSELDTPDQRLVRINQVEEEIKDAVKDMIKTETKAAKTKTKEPVKNGSDITVEQLRAAVSAKATAGLRAELKDLLSTFGAENVTALAPEKYAEFLTAVNAL